ncbi:MAG: TraR/DksA C4-type zinc finger protein [bacterium]|nr:TraR/DksA C4-type zinc finger protein [bacterium]
MLEKALFEELQAFILAEKHRLEGELGLLGEGNPHVTGGFDTKWEDLGENEEDNATEVAQYESNLGVERELESRLKEMKAALARLEDGTYGACASCGQDINPARLKVKPEAIYCIECSEKLQR